MKITLTSFLLHLSVCVFVGFFFSFFCFSHLIFVLSVVHPDVQDFKMHAGFEWTVLRYKGEASSDIQVVAETLSISPLPQRLICSDGGVDSILITAEICILK